MLRVLTWALYSHDNREVTDQVEKMHMMEGMIHNVEYGNVIRRHPHRMQPERQIECILQKFNLITQIYFT